ncbi:MAG: hypothetical protein BGO54_04295 [Sphingobacteriales bacterium 46-32]|nr:MAG: hypothetical protein BGO54_04295 [Sphingobacteriales bacterium 46-32]
MPERFNSEEIAVRSNGHPDLLIKRSADISELISSKPPFVQRHGVTILAAIGVLVAALAWFIRYPDTVPATAVLNSIDGPREVVTRTNGKLVKILVHNEEAVEKGQPLAFLESTANHQEVIRLSNWLDTIGYFLEDSPDKLTLFVNQRFRGLGELQMAYQTFATKFQEFGNYLSNGFYVQKRGMLTRDMQFLEELEGQLQEEHQLMNLDLLLSDTTFKGHESLQKDRVISPMEYRNERSKLISKQLTIPQVRMAIINNKSQLHEKRKEVAELDNQILQQQLVFTQALQTLKSQVEEWKMKYILIAPLNGQITFVGFFQENQEIKADQTICFVNPSNSNYYAEAFVPQYNLGKIRTGQKVLLKLTAYPWEEFGILEGELAYLNNIPSDSGFLAKISLPHDLVTNQEKKIQFRMGLQAKAEIVVADSRLIDRFFRTLRRDYTK